MSSTVQVSTKTVNNREVVVLTKEYGDETHEVYVPRNQLAQLVINLLTIMNDDKEAQADEYVLIRKSELGYIHE